MWVRIPGTSLLEQLSPYITYLLGTSVGTVYCRIYLPIQNYTLVYGVLRCLAVSGGIARHYQILAEHISPLANVVLAPGNRLNGKGTMVVDTDKNYDKTAGGTGAAIGRQEQSPILLSTNLPCNKPAQANHPSIHMVLSYA